MACIPRMPWLDVQTLMQQPPSARARLLLDLKDKEPHNFAEIVHQLACGIVANEGRELLAAMLVQSGRFGSFLREKCQNAEDGIALLTAGLCLDPNLDVAICREVADIGDFDRSGALYLLHVLENASDLRRLTIMLSQLSHHSDEFVRSKAAQLFAASNVTPAWLAAQLRSPSPRVRSNSIEGCLPNPSPELTPLFRDALRDNHHRVRATAALALHTTQPLEAVAALHRMLDDKRPAHQAAAAWAISRTENPEFLPALEKFAKDPATRYLVLRPLASLRRGAETVPR